MTSLIRRFFSAFQSISAHFCPQVFCLISGYRLYDFFINSLHLTVFRENFAYFFRFIPNYKRAQTGQVELEVCFRGVRIRIGDICGIDNDRSWLGVLRDRDCQSGCSKTWWLIVLVCN